MMSNYLTATPEFKTELRELEFKAAHHAGVNTLATVYHACHRELCHYEDGTSFEIINFMEIIGESMGLKVPDRYKQLKKLADMEEIVEAARAEINTNALDMGDVRASVAIDMLGQSPGGQHAPE